MASAQDVTADAAALYAQAQIACQRGNLAEGAELARRLLTVDPGCARAHELLGMALARLGRREDALASFDAAIARAPERADAHANRGDVLAELGRRDEAVASYDRALALAPDSVDNWCNRGAVMHDLERYGEALASYDRVIALAPDFTDVHCNRGHALRQLGRDEEALASYERAFALEPNHIDAHICHGATLRKLERHAQALASYRRALAISPRHVTALMGQGAALIELARHAEALASFDGVLSVEPDNVDALNNRGLVLDALSRRDEALASYAGALALDPDHAGALFNRGLTLAKLGRFSAAAVCYRQLLAARPDHPHALGELFACVVMTCDWANTAALLPQVVAKLASGDLVISPFELRAVETTPAQHLACARNWLRQKDYGVPDRPCERKADRPGKTRIAYLSSDFRAHPVTYLVTELFELHDRKRFEILGISYGPDDGSDMRARVVKAFDRFIDVRDKSDDGVARLLRDLEVDIIVDLNGHTDQGRLGILARRPAPIQVSYLGFAASTAAPFLDYILADKTALPFEQQPFFTEKIVHLPDSYYVTESKRRIAARTPSRAEAGLPEGAFVFCCFNQNYKISEQIFDVWMRLLRAIDGSVLWLLRSEAAADNLRRAAAARGVHPDRIVFADKIDPADNLARHQLADLFLDTLPYNAHTTATDALWAGLPIVTCLGETFVGRVAASQLRAAGMPELVTYRLDEYEALALKLAREPALLGSIRAKILRNWPTCALFDTDRFRRHIESAYLTMCEINRRGEAPRSFSVAAIAG
ncbi:MAG: protein O-GlcNAc transferase [Alphaproteobacteria bacterium]|nr:protein O-GlcNAc transferase [Alphaproteobacteria bacterium]